MPHTGLISVVQRLSMCRDLSEVMTLLRDSARALTGADGITVVLRDGDLCHYADENAIAPLWKGQRFPMKACISGWCMLHRQQVVIEDIYADARIPHDAYRPTFVKSLAMTPIRSEDPIGAIGAYWASHHAATEAELETLQALGDSASVAIANAQLIGSLKQANERKDRFISLLAHELRNPLAPIRYALQVMRVRPDDLSAVTRSRDVIERQAHQLGKLVDDLLEVARVNTGKIQLRLERLDLAKLVRECAVDREDLFSAMHLNLNIEVPAAPVWVLGDRTRLGQVISNILENSGKFTPAGGSVAVKLVSVPGEQRALLTIRDTGVGIEPELLPIVFDTFAQADRSLDRTAGGLGLGLSVAKGLVELHEGSITIRSEGKNKGTEVAVRIPVEVELPSEEDLNFSVEPTRKSVRVLVVEDSPDSAESLRILLEIYGYHVTVANDGRAGVEMAMKMKPNIVLCDLGLPELDGFGVAKALRGMPEFTDARIIAVTGYGDEEHVRRSMAAGFNAHLVKPVDPETLLAQLSLVPG